MRTADLWGLRDSEKLDNRWTVDSDGLNDCRGCGSLGKTGGGTGCEEARLGYLRDYKMGNDPYSCHAWSDGQRQTTYEVA